ncbi:MAG: hypothetical protein HYW78_02985 [Parcubacteria group bacterium]|nr:hypothetical protein [Parcubacteria group bacterium]
MTMNKKVIVTVGATREFIDDIRFISNVSKGRFGYEIAKALARSGYTTTVLCPKEVPPWFYGECSVEINHEYFTDTQSLENLILNQNDIQIVFHAAAVSDFRPRKKVSGKISSHQENLTIELERTQKNLGKHHLGRKQYLSVLSHSLV